MSIYEILPSKCVNSHWTAIFLDSFVSNAEKLQRLMCYVLSRNRSTFNEDTFKKLVKCVEQRQKKSQLKLCLGLWDPQVKGHLRLFDFHERIQHPITRNIFFPNLTYLITTQNRIMQHLSRYLRRTLSSIELSYAHFPISFFFFFLLL